MSLASKPCGSRRDYLAFAVPYVFADLLTVQRNVYYAIYAFDRLCRHH
jgi:hypothetical protein